MKQEFIILIAVIIVAVIGGASFFALVILPNQNNNKTPGPTVNPTAAPTSPTPTAEPTIEATAAPKHPTWFNYLQLTKNSQDVAFTGYLQDGWSNEGAGKLSIPNLTITIVDANTGAVYGTTTTLTVMNFSQNLNVGGFYYAFPLTTTNLSVKAVFAGDNQYQPCESQAVTYSAP